MSSCSTMTRHSESFLGYSQITIRSTVEHSSQTHVNLFNSKWTLRGLTGHSKTTMKTRPGTFPPESCDPFQKQSDSCQIVEKEESHSEKLSHWEVTLNNSSYSRRVIIGGRGQTERRGDVTGFPLPVLPHVLSLNSINSSKFIQV